MRFHVIHHIYSQMSDTSPRTCGRNCVHLRGSPWRTLDDVEVEDFGVHDVVLHLLIHLRHGPPRELHDLLARELEHLPQVLELLVVPRGTAAGKNAGRHTAFALQMNLNQIDGLPRDC